MARSDGKNNSANLQLLASPTTIYCAGTTLLTILLEKDFTIYRNPVMIKGMENKDVKEYLSKIGRRGGKKSKRTLTAETARNMVRLREARKAFQKYHTQCFWSYDPKYSIQYKDIPWVAEQLMKNGNRKLWLLGAKLCR